MIGYWDQECPVKTSHPDVKATAYVKSGKTLVSVGNFNEADLTVRLTFDWQALGLDPARVEIRVPEVQDFQQAGAFRLNEPVPVKGKQGWLLILQEK